MAQKPSFSFYMWPAISRQVDEKVGVGFGMDTDYKQEKPGS